MRGWAGWGGQGGFSEEVTPSLELQGQEKRWASLPGPWETGAAKVP